MRVARSEAEHSSLADVNGGVYYKRGRAERRARKGSGCPTVPNRVTADAVVAMLRWSQSRLKSRQPFRYSAEL